MSTANRDMRRPAGIETLCFVSPSLLGPYVHSNLRSGALCPERGTPAVTMSTPLARRFWVTPKPRYPADSPASFVHALRARQAHAEAPCSCFRQLCRRDVGGKGNENQRSCRLLISPVYSSSAVVEIDEHQKSCSSSSASALQTRLT